MKYRIVLHRNKIKGHWWWVLKSAGNGAVLATSETYTTRRKAWRTAHLLAMRLNVLVEDQG